VVVQNLQSTIRDDFFAAPCRAAVNWLNNNWN